MNYDALARENKAMETQLKEANEKLLFYAHIPSVEEAGMFNPASLTEQAEFMPHLESMRSV